MRKKIDFEKAAIGFLEYWLKMFKGDLEAVCSDYRAGSIPRQPNYYCQIGGLYTTTPEKPGRTIVIRKLVGQGIVAKFTVEEIYKKIKEK